MRNILSLIALLILIPALTLAEDTFIPPDQIHISTPAYLPDIKDFDPPLGSYTYEVSWQGIPAAELTMDVARDSTQYHLIATARTYSFIDIFYKLRYRAEGHISKTSFKPSSASFDYRENSRIKNTKITFLHDGKIRSVREQNGREPYEIEFNPKNPTLDPFSSAFIARSLPWEDGQEREFDTFNGKSRYLIKLKNEKTVKMRVNGEVRDVWVIVPTVKNLTSTSTEKKLREARIYITADKQRELLMIESEAFVGTVKTKLTTFSPAQPELTQVAQIKQNISFD